MPTAPISMRKLKEIIRLKYGCELTHRQIAKSLSISPGSVSTYVNRAAQLNITSWPLAASWDEQSLHQAFFNTKAQPKRYALPDWSIVQQELRPKTMTLQLLWRNIKNVTPKVITAITIIAANINLGLNAKSHQCDKIIKRVKSCLLTIAGRR